MSSSYTVIWDGTPNAPAGPYLVTPQQDTRAPKAAPRVARDWTPLMDALRAQPQTVRELAAQIDVPASVLSGVMGYLQRRGDLVVVGERRRVRFGKGCRTIETVYGWRADA